jgi:competence protein ComEC
MHKPLRLLLFLVLLVLVSAAAFFLHWKAEKARETEIIFLDVGQGDAILITQGNRQVLIDGGRDPVLLLSRVGRVIPFWDRSIDAVIATHPDSDHIGGLSGIFRAYRVAAVFTNGQNGTTDTWRDFKERAERETDTLETLSAGGEIDFPRGGKLSVEYPRAPLPEESTSETNDGSIVARFVYGKTSFLLTGDLPHEETALPKEEPASVLKVAHHGSKYSTSDAFLDLVSPAEAVISVGPNDYGHPDPGVLDRLARRGITLRRTDQEGSIRYRCEETGCRALVR